MSDSPSEPDLTFHWPVEKGFPFVLFACVAGSLFAHVATFFLFQVVYPQRVTIPQPAPHVSLLTPSSPENIALLRWIEAEDPALIATDNAVSPPGLVSVRYRPSFAVPRTAPLGAPVEKPKEVSFPPAFDRIVSTPMAVAPAAPVASGASTTIVRFGDALATRPLIQEVRLDVPRLATEPVRPTVLLAGVNAAGEVRYQFIQQPSGELALDNFAVAHLHRLAFAPASEVITWAHVTFAWGADAYVERGGPAGATP